MPSSPKCSSSVVTVGRPPRWCFPRECPCRATNSSLNLWAESNWRMAETNQEDPYAFMLELCRISPSQEELLRHCPFVGETLLHSPHDADQPSPSSAEIPVASTAVVMVSLPETQDAGKDSSGPQDVFHTPPEESSLPTSDDQRRKRASDHCPVNQAVDVDDGTQGFVDLGGYSEGAEYVDLGGDSDLGFSEVQLGQRVDGELVAECSRGIEGDDVGEISMYQFNKFGVSEIELSSKGDDDLGELPLKKVKLSEQISGFNPSGDGFISEQQKVEEGVGNCEGKLVSDTDTENPCNFVVDLQPQNDGLAEEKMSVDAGNEDNACAETSMDKNLGSHENVETQVIQSETIGSAGDVNFCETDKLPCAVKGNKASDKVVETSEMEQRRDEQQERRVLPSSIRERLGNAAKELESGKGLEEEKISIFYALKVLSENSEEESLENVSLLEAAKIRGITFPPPRWDKDNCREHRIV